MEDVHCPPPRSTDCLLARWKTKKGKWAAEEAARKDFLVGIKACWERRDERREEQMKHWGAKKHQRQEKAAEWEE
jgi:hypothetical protein